MRRWRVEGERWRDKASSTPADERSESAGHVRPALLVSVRDPLEAEAALAGGAQLIDVKEPNNGSLGRADDDVIANVIRQVAGRRPVSAALGELRDGAAHPRTTGLSYLKWGLAECGARADWREQLRRQRTELRDVAEVVTVAYADWQAAGAPPVEDVVAFACAVGGVLLLDTFDKTRYQGEPRSLLDWLSIEELAAIRARCLSAQVRLALAGALSRAHIQRLLPVAPDWFAVRGAACDGDRSARVSAERVRQLAAVLAGTSANEPALDLQ